MKRYPIEGQSARRQLWTRIKGGIIITLFIIFALWAGLWWLLLLPLLIDFYFTRIINWCYLRQHPNPLVRTLGTLLEDVVFVVVMVSLIFTYFFQNFAIPSSSLEKTLLIGDYLFVFNFHPTRSHVGYPINVPEGAYSVVIDTDSKAFGGYGLIDDSLTYATQPAEQAGTAACPALAPLRLYLPARTALVLKRNTNN